MTVHWNKRKPVYGWGINDLPYTVKPCEKDENGKRVDPCPYYDRWIHVLKRTLSDKTKAKHTSYVDASVCDIWQKASVFRSWMESQVWEEPGRKEKLQLDKDILIPCNKVYSPETCAFVPRELNCVLIIIDNELGVPGVVKRTNNYGTDRYIATISTRNVKSDLGSHKTLEAAHAAWQLAKIERLEFELNEYRNLVCYRSDVDAAILKRISKLRQDYEEGRITYSL